MHRRKVIQALRAVARHAGNILMRGMVAGIGALIAHLINRWLETGSL
ncbi:MULTISPECIES: hypothetical protein [Nocardia]|nr:MULTISPECIES: hypothetical protein [Nocardia]MBF6272900.1 hypothetical protein [Nocardia nova]